MTDPVGGPARREVLAWLGALVAVPMAAPHRVAWGNDGGDTLYLSARNDATGHAYASGFDATGEPRLDLALPGRGHAFAVSPRRPEAVLFSRRPGQTALVIDLARDRVLATIEHARHRLFCGHGVYASGGALLLATEEAGEEGHGVVGCYDPAQEYRRVGEFSSHGIGPHEMTVLGDGRTVVVANGGYVTSPDASGVKLDRDRMRPSLALLDARDGRLLAEGRLPEPLWRLSLRHLAIGRGDLIAVAAQDEGEPGDLLPLAAVWRRRAGLELLDAGPGVTPRMRGYCGSAAVDVAGALLGVSCPRGGLAVFWDLETARVIGTVDLADGCGLAPGAAPGRFLLTSGRGGVVRVEPGDDRTTALPATFTTRGRWDNHLAVGRLAPASS
ncbi:MAG TPA: DUF1513 domain-containing protein [Methylomirabilota bacterium]